MLKCNIRICKLVDDTVVSIKDIELESTEQAENHWKRLKDLYTSNVCKEMSFVIELYIDHDLYDTIAITHEQADWLITQFYGQK